LKVLFFKFGKKQNSERASKNLNFFEKLLFTAFIVCFIALIAVQITLSSPALRPLVSVDGRYEGNPLKTEEYLYDVGEVTIKLVKPEPENNIGILLNGEEAAVFSGNEVTLEVLDGDVIEIDASAAKSEIEVRITNVSDNLSRKYIGKSLTVKGSVKILSQILF
jgi:hypothetical protein